MGCDIHLIVEYRAKNRPDDWANGWWSLSDHPINPGRRYRLFGLLAGVRGEAEAIVAPRGVPDDMSYCAKEAYCVTIVPPATPESPPRAGDPELQPPKSEEEDIEYLIVADWCGERGFEATEKALRHAHYGRHVTPDVADRWIQSGCSRVYQTFDNGMYLVTHPDWHTPSWLTAAEFRKAINRYNRLIAPSDGTAGIEYTALLASIEAIDKLGYEVRVVFWFDN